MLFPTRWGTSQHERLVYPKWYHETRIHQVTRSEDEMVLVAREENRLVAKGRLCGNMAFNHRVNQDLFRAFPGRSADAIRSLGKTMKYRKLQNRLALVGHQPRTQSTTSSHGSEVVDGGGRLVSTPQRGGNEREGQDRTGPKLQWTAGELEGRGQAGEQKVQG